MTVDANERSLNAYARIGGFLYLLVMIVYVAGTLLMDSFHVRGEFAQTAANIDAGELLYRTGLCLLLAGSVATILLGGVLYALLKRVDENLALFALLWRVAEAALGGVVVAFGFIALSVYTGNESGFPQSGQQILASLFSVGRFVGFFLSIIYFSAGSLLFFFLLFRSRFIPPALSAFGMLASALASVLGFAYLLFPVQAAALGMAGWAPIFITEVAVGFWLLIKGADLTYWNSRSEAAALPAKGSGIAAHR